jgi:hypothetical protein
VSEKGPVQGELADDPVERQGVHQERQPEVQTLGGSDAQGDVARFGRPGGLAERDADVSRGRGDVPVLEALDEVFAGFVVGGGGRDQVGKAAA